MKKVAVVVGTRPGIVKMSPLIHELTLRGNTPIVIHTAQHYSYSMDRQFFLDLQLPEPDFHLRRSRKGSLHGEQTAQMLKGTEAALLQALPRVVLVCGDANTNFAAAVAARKLHMTVGHVEAGLRSFDWSMPEEHNRVMIDHISDLLFAPTEEGRANLQAERVRGEIHVTGNTVVDALVRNSTRAAESSKFLDRLGLRTGRYVLATIHREENVDDLARLELIVEALLALQAHLSLDILFPMHPRTLGRLRSSSLFNRLEVTGMHLVPPLGYLDFLAALSSAHLVATDSGGIQEEACVLHVPCVTLRNNTERPETVEVGANIVSGLRSEDVVRAARTLLKRARNWPIPIGDGHAAERIVDVVLEHL